jgi:hypothetical protein
MRIHEDSAAQDLANGNIMAIHCGNYQYSTLLLLPFLALFLRLVA